MVGPDPFTGGWLIDNTITGNTNWAGISLFGSNWLIENMTTTNIVRGNTVSSWYGILLVGNDEQRPYWAPRNNTIANNNVFGSNHGCADDFRPGQWSTDRNTWSGNNCTGAANSGPTYF